MGVYLDLATVHPTPWRSGAMAHFRWNAEAEAIEQTRIREADAAAARRRRTKTDPDALKAELDRVTSDLDREQRGIDSRRRIKAAAVAGGRCGSCDAPIRPDGSCACT
jgi:hypothetical protein